MKFAALSTLFLSSVFSAPADTASNYNLLTTAIQDFQSNSDYTWQLIMTALSQEKALLNSFSTSTVGNLTLFLPADAGFLSLNLATLSQNDLYTYLQYHVAINAPSGTGYKRTYVGDDVNVNGTHVLSALGHAAKILGSEAAGDNVVLYFIDEVLTPPLSLRDTAAHYNWTTVTAVLDAAKAADLSYTTSKDNTYLIPSEASLATLVAANCPPSQWSTDFTQLLLQTLSFSSGRVYSADLNPAGGTIVSNSKIPATYTINNGTVTFTLFGISAPVTVADVQVQHGVVHVVELDSINLPSIKGYCK